MQVTVNGKNFTFHRNINLEQLIIKLQISQEHGIAVALNYSIISKSQLANTKIKDGDRLEIIHATAGG